ncbi:hypothetical protein E2562_037238 [Oryza meyeriana var. granulata]|uniref:Uncharacterized protein n=1 Tax=Oryza meyeriana var. granulata TaxID=110450 RepID=A0A6G1CKK6_9ORYZ|nr:hypothetical protein E2562_037238 [Oryza meyeriana var. granulata]
MVYFSPGAPHLPPPVGLHFLCIPCCRRHPDSPTFHPPSPFTCPHLFRPLPFLAPPCIEGLKPCASCGHAKEGRRGARFPEVDRRRRSMSEKKAADGGRRTCGEYSLRMLASLVPRPRRCFPAWEPLLRSRRRHDSQLPKLPLPN